MLFAISSLTLAQTANENTVENKAELLLSALRKDLNALQAEFKQYELTSDNRTVEENSGTVWMQAPDLFKWHYQEPFEQLIVADGAQVWVYDEDLQQVTVKSQKNNLNPIYVIINEELSTRYYDISYEGNQDHLDWVKLTPKEDSNEVNNVMLGIEENQLQCISLPFGSGLGFSLGLIHGQKANQTQMTRWAIDFRVKNSFHPLTKNLKQGYYTTLQTSVISQLGQAYYELNDEERSTLC